MIRSATLSVALITAAGTAAAQDGSVVPPSDLRKELFGVHLYGIETATGADWDECIERSGETVYRADSDSPYSQAGALVIDDRGQACFFYPPGSDPTPSCFVVTRQGSGYRFSAPAALSTFLTTKVTRDVVTCPDPGQYVG